MRGAFVIAVALFGLGAATCGGASCLSIMNFEPPHPYWQFPVRDVATHPERARFDPVAEHEYEVSIYPPESGCTLTIRSLAGATLAKGGEGTCFVSLSGRAGDTWLFDATSRDPEAQIQVATPNPIFPSPLGKIAATGAVTAVLGALVALVALVRKGQSPTLGT